MSEIRIKYYGVWPVTRRGYLAATMVASAIALGAVLAGILIGRLPPLSTIWQPLPPVLGQEGYRLWLYNHLYHLMLIGVFLEAIDIFVVLRRFHKLQAAQQAGSVGNQPTNLQS
jgi:hypothetical protein